MKNYFSKKIFVVCLIGLVIVVAGCSFNGCDWSKAKYEKTMELQAPLQAGLTLEAKTEYGSVTIEGSDVTGCSVIAKITGRAPTEEEALEIAEKVQIRLETSFNGLIIEADKPRVKNNRSISISYEITVPRQTSIEAGSCYGSVKLSGLNGSVNASTSYGSIDCKDVEGRIKLETAYGKITCSDIIFDELFARSSYGGIDIECSDKALADIRADVGTAYGSIDFKAPKGFAGEVELGTSYGSVETGFPVTVQGKISNKRLRGAIGEGNGSLQLKTSYGSIKLR